MTNLAQGVSRVKSQKNKLNSQLQKIVTKHYGLVVKIARHVSSKMPSSVQIDDLIQSGMIGLLEAAKKFDKNKGATFETFSGIRIRGAMLDEIRKGDWGPRSVYRNNRKVNAAEKIVEAKMGRYAHGREVAKEMDISINEYFKIIKDIKGCRLFSFEEMFESEELKIPNSAARLSPHIQFVDDKFKAELEDAIDKLPEREKIVLIMYYNEEFNLKQIGDKLGVSESRVSQIHSQAAIKLKGILKHWA